MEAITLDPTRTGLLVFDLLEGARAKIEVRGILEPVLRLVEGCRAVGVPIFFTRPMHRPDASDYARSMPDMNRLHVPYDAEHPHASGPGTNSAGSALAQPLAEFKVTEADYDITKHRWSAFYETPLDLSLRTAGIDTLLVVGGTTHIGVASTVYSARDRDYQVVVVRDGCHGEAEELQCLLDFIFPQVCRVRTVDEVLAAFA
jgi:nicotinamidase-related amidase